MSTPLAEYAAEYWVSHARVGSISSHVMGTMKTLFDPDKPHFTTWVQIYDIDRPRWEGACKDPLAKPLYYSVLCGFYDLVEHLVKSHSQHVNTFGGSHHYPLVAALQGGHVRVADFLLQHGANVDFRGTNSVGHHWTPLHSVAVLPNHLVGVSAAQFLLEHGASVNPRHWQFEETPLHLAAQSEYFEVVRMLLQHGAEVNSPDARGHTPLYSMDISQDPLTEESRLNTFQVLLEYGADVNSRGRWRDSTLLHDASFLHQLDVVRTLLDHGADANVEDNRGRTPLHQVIKGSDDSRFAITQLLVKHGADVNVRDKYHVTPLHLASFCNPETELVQFLLDNGANVNIEDNWSQTPLHRVLKAKTYHWAGSWDEIFDVAQLLIERMVDVNAGERKMKQEPKQCMKCRKWGHFAADCLAEKDVCGNCGEDHRTKDCPDKDKRYCASCKVETHASWDRECPEFQRRVDRMDENHPENALAYFPTEEDWTLHIRPHRLELDERFPAKYAVASLPPPPVEGERLATTRPVGGKRKKQQVRRKRTKESGPMDEFVERMRNGERSEGADGKEDGSASEVYSDDEVDQHLNNAYMEE